MHACLCIGRSNIKRHQAVEAGRDQGLFLLLTLPTESINVPTAAGRFRTIVVTPSNRQLVAVSVKVTESEGAQVLYRVYCGKLPIISIITTQSSDLKKMYNYVLRTVTPARVTVL